MTGEIESTPEPQGRYVMHDKTVFRRILSILLILALFAAFAACSVEEVRRIGAEAPETRVGEETVPAATAAPPETTAVPSETTASTAPPETTAAAVTETDALTQTTEAAIRTETVPVRGPLEEPSLQETAPTTTGTVRTYVLNKNTKKFHYPDCSSVRDIKEKNKWVYEGTREEIIEMGYQPCKRCNP